MDSPPQIGSWLSGDESSVTVAVSGHELRMAVRAVAVHAAEPWPHGVYCRNDRAPFPCRLRRWGPQVLRTAGWSDEEIATAVQTLRESTTRRSVAPGEG